MTSIFQQRTIPVTQADWAATVSFNQFDPNSGTLLNAVITTAGSIDASASIENLAPVAAIINLGVAATINASTPGLGNLASMTPEAVASVNLGAFQGSFDGTLDFSSPSGTVLPHITASEVQQVVVTPGLAGPGTVTSIAPLLGTGTFDVNVTAYATSTVEGNGNLAVLLHGSIGATLSVDFVEATSESDNTSSSNDASGASTFFVPILTIDNKVTTTPQVVTLASQTSGWTSTASFNQFDPALGTLDEILVYTGNTIAGTFSAENLEGVPATVFMSENASTTVGAPGSATGIIANAGISESFNLGGYDGSTDFAGASGLSDIVTNPRFGDQAGSATLTAGAALSAFTGTGTIALPVSTAGTSTVTGPSNLLEEITQQTGGTVSVSYVYTPASGNSQTPTPATSGAAMIGTGLWAGNAPGLTFIGASPDNKWFYAQPGQTFLLAPSASTEIANFSLTGGDKLNLNALLDGAPLAHDLSNLGSFLTVAKQSQNVLGGTDTTLAIGGPGGAASVVLFNVGSVSVLDLVSDNALVLPGH